MAIGLAVRAFTKAATYLWNKPITLGTAAVATAVPAAVMIVDHETDGALSHTTLKTTVDYLKGKVKDGASAEEIETMMNAASYISDVSKTFRKGAQSYYVEQRMQQKDGADAILAGKRAAVEFQLLPDNVAALGAKYFIRTAIADELHKGDRNTADKYIANTLIDDIVNGAQVIPLKGNQVSRDDVKAALVDVINHPEKHPVASRFFEGQDRLMNGLRQTWPELSGPAPLAAQLKEERKKEEGLSGMFGMAANGESSLMKIFAFFLAMMMQMLGMGKSADNNLANQNGPEDEVKQPAKPAPALRPSF